MTRLALAAIAVLVLVLSLMAESRLTFPAALFAVAGVIAACLVLACLIATSLGRLIETRSHYGTSLNWSTR